jgi:hypothetical protein
MRKNNSRKRKPKFRTSMVTTSSLQLGKLTERPIPKTFVGF